MADDDNFDIDIYGDDSYQDSTQQDTTLTDAHTSNADISVGDSNDSAGNAKPADGDQSIKHESLAETTNGAEHHDHTTQQIASTGGSAGTQDVHRQAPQQQGTKRKQGEDDDRPLDAGATSALLINDVNWWVSEEDIRGWANQSHCEDELIEVTFNEHKVNGKSKGQVYAQLRTPQAATALKHQIDQLFKEQTHTKKPTAIFNLPNSNPFKTLPKDVPQREKGRNDRVTPGGNYNNQGTGNFNKFNNNRGNFNNHRGGNMGFQNNNRNFSSPAGGNMGNNMGFGTPQTMVFGNPMGNMNNFGGFNRGGMMGNNMRGGMNNRGGRGGMMNNMGGNPMGMNMPMNNNMGMMGGGGMMGMGNNMGGNMGGNMAMMGGMGAGFGGNQQFNSGFFGNQGGNDGSWQNPHGAKRPRPE